MRSRSLTSAAAPAPNPHEIRRVAAALTDPSGRLVVCGPSAERVEATIRAGADAARAVGQLVAIANLAAVPGATSVATIIREAASRALEWPTRANESSDLADWNAIEAILRDADRALAATGGTMGLVVHEFTRLEALLGHPVDWPLKALFESQRRIAFVLSGTDVARISEMLALKGAGLWKAVDTLFIADASGACTDRP